LALSADASISDTDIIGSFALSFLALLVHSRQIQNFTVCYRGYLFFYNHHIPGILAKKKLKVGKQINLLMWKLRSIRYAFKVYRCKSYKNVAW
jgi:hypothetical protein